MFTPRSHSYRKSTNRAFFFAKSISYILSSGQQPSWLPIVTDSDLLWNHHKPTAVLGFLTLLRWHDGIIALFNFQILTLIVVVYRDIYIYLLCGQCAILMMCNFVIETNNLKIIFDQKKTTYLLFVCHAVTLIYVIKVQRNPWICLNKKSKFSFWPLIWRDFQY